MSQMTVDTDVVGLIDDIETMDDADAVRAVLDDEVAREDVRKDVVAACNIRLDTLAEQAAKRAHPGDPEYDREFRAAKRVAKAFDLDQVSSRLAQERARDPPRAYVVDALEERREDLLSQEVID